MTGEVETTNKLRSRKGPHGLGDPNDYSLRKVEEDVLIPQKMRDKAREQKCVKEVEEFSQCCKDASYFMGFKCREQNSALKLCMEKWYCDEKFKEECKQEYLEERKQYRITGVPKKYRSMKQVSS
ncbi:PREDICTED: COX assembly mitochondrial protein homolog [Dufourea novaeangliae]|uniref:COX assembly mitochondrial protein n=1 Tax=Dufourea novaeangliae TaxID=178035 RepID=A0A154PSH8_DUFNO|nr:PREDICTED: COX assembly mitochondrial protein homolog [Dufourea novaeangliae]KZC14875.1 COX assembly mitochondrial protein like protein [Dufourea novaeangliae]